MDEEINKALEGQLRMIQIQPLVMPGPVAGSINLVIFGLGDDGKLYQWEGKAHKWIPA